MKPMRGKSSNKPMQTYCPTRLKLLPERRYFTWLEFYEPRYSPDGPAMGGAILSVSAARWGTQRAFSMFEKSYRFNELHL